MTVLDEAKAALTEADGEGELTGDVRALIIGARYEADQLKIDHPSRGCIGCLICSVRATLEHAADVIELLDPALRALVVEYETFTTEYRPGWIGDDGRARITSPATVHPDYVAEYRAEGGEVVRRLVGPWEVVEDAQ